MTASLYFAGKEWLAGAAGAFAVALVFIGWSYVRADAPRGIRAVCAGLKTLGVLLLLACLLEPMWSGERAKPGANAVAVIADNSQSMKLRGDGERETRAEAVQRVLGEGGQWRAKLAENFAVRNYLADSRLQPTEDFRELTFDGRASSLGRALELLAERYRGQPLAGVVLLTDGIAGDLGDVSKLVGLPPIFPVVPGGSQPARDLAIAGTSVSQTSFEDAPVTVLAELASSGFEGAEVVGKLFAIDGEEKPVAEETVKIPRESGKAALTFRIRPEKTGVLFYKLRVAAKGGELSTEATAANNETIVCVDRGAGPHRVLYVGGRPNWEFKFLRRAVEGDDQVQLVGLIRIAKREPKFEFRGRAGEQSNPLFRGFGKQGAEEVERYDQPVLTRLGTEDEHELRGGFPKTAEELFRYRAVIVDDLEAEFFTADQQSLVQRFVSARGGGLLMLGGAESFAEGKYARTAIGDVLPVYVDKTTVPQPAELQLSLTREGWLQPWVRLRTSEAEEKRRLGELPAMDVLNRAGGVKPAAQVVATTTDGRAEFPALVTQRFGRGRSAALLAGDLWHTGLGDEARAKDLAKAWRQMVRWLVADVPAQVEVSLAPLGDAQTMRIAVRARDAKFQPLDNATVTLRVQPVGVKGEAITLTTEPSASEPGVYEASYIARDSGGYRVEAEVKNEQSAPAGTAAAGWTTDLAAAEFRSLTPNLALMEQLAKHTGGAVLSPEQLDAWARELPSKRAPVTETWTRPLWHTPWVLLVAIACLAGEWGVRRWKGLA